MILYEVPVWIVRMIFMIFMLLSVVLVVNFFVATEINVQQAQSEVAARALLATPGLIVDADGVIRSVPQDIAWESANEAIVAARITVDGQHSYYNRERFERWNTLVEAGLTQGAGGAQKLVGYRLMPMEKQGRIETVGVIYEIVTLNS